jgi:hypothetical protein
MITPSSTFMEHTLRVIQIHLDISKESGAGPSAELIHRACDLALNTQENTLDEIAAYPKLESFFVDEFRAARASVKGLAQEGA